MMKRYLHEAIAEDNTSGAEYFLASIVQDAVIHECYQTEDHENLSSMAHRAARLALSAVHESMGLNSFIVCETVRGIIHGLVSLGGEPFVMTREVIRGICMEAMQSNFSYDDIVRGVSVGVKMTARDLGVNSDSLFQLAEKEILSYWNPSNVEQVPTYGGLEQVSATQSDDAEVELPDFHLEMEIEATINKTLSQQRKRPYIKYRHGRLR